MPRPKKATHVEDQTAAEEVAEGVEAKKPEPGVVKVRVTKNFVYFKGRFYHAGEELEVDGEEASLLLREGCAKEA
ncbi:hypothetical protein [Thermus phage P23-45]|uniref:DUF7210 domain-containing protein n=1 Tax=Thermus virus P23-45 TaxID=2914006 RepID=A7XXC3_BP234|nr:hypothetical protein P23p90 [Thermus phage P23-45]ABU96923.1 hypothetical protein P23p90 [Thermus phage P23-45]UYB98501.1 hypothetical protein [Thermus phage P23-45]